MKEQQPDWYSLLQEEPLAARTFGMTNIQQVEHKTSGSIGMKNRPDRWPHLAMIYAAVICAALILSVSLYNRMSPAVNKKTTDLPIVQTQSPSLSPGTLVYKLKGEVGAVEQPSQIYGVMPPKFVADPDQSYKVVGRDGSLVQITAESSSDPTHTGWIPEWYLSTDDTAKIQKVDPYELIVAKSVPYRLFPEEPVPSGFDLDIGKVVQVTGKFDHWLRVNIITYDSPYDGDKWVPESALDKWDPQKAMEGFLKPGAKVYDEAGQIIEAPNSNPIRIAIKQGDQYFINSAGGYFGVIAKQDFIPNPFKPVANR